MEAVPQPPMLIQQAAEARRRFEIGAEERRAAEAEAARCAALDHARFRAAEAARLEAEAKAAVRREAEERRWRDQEASAERRRRQQEEQAVEALRKHAASALSAATPLWGRVDTGKLRQAIDAARQAGVQRATRGAPPSIQERSPRGAQGANGVRWGRLRGRGAAHRQSRSAQGP